MPRTTSESHTPLFRAVSANHLAVVQFLLGRGCEVLDKVEVSTGDSPLHVAVNNQDAAICLALCSSCPSLLFQKDKCGRSPLDSAPDDLKNELIHFLPS